MKTPQRPEKIKSEAFSREGLGGDLRRSRHGAEGEESAVQAETAAGRFIGVYGKLPAV